MESLPELFSGSWIDGNFATWVGHPEKNAAWEHLTQARHALQPLSRENPAYAKAWKSLGAAEGSDWMWWFGDTHFTAQADEFDRLFRAHLTNCYQLAGLSVPAALASPIRRPVAQPLYEPTGPIQPVIDGRESSYYEWLYAGRCDLKQQYSATHRSEQCFQRFHYGFDQTQHYLRLDLDRSQLDRSPSWMIELTFGHGARVQITPALSSADGTQRAGQAEALEVHATLLGPSRTTLSCALGTILEVAIPMERLGLKAGEKLRLTLSLNRDGACVERHPAEGSFALMVSASDLETQTWSA